jgi:isopentenyl-diphosphate Delta-isomerase
MDVILVDEQDKAIGTMGKLEVHEKAILHRAFSIFIFNDKGEMLLQKRADNKYHSAGLWTNACCSHPRPGEDTLAAAQKRLDEEMGFTTVLNKAFSFIYKAPFDNGLTEHEYDHVFTGTYNGLVYPNPIEVSEYCYLPVAAIKSSIQTKPGNFTEWFKIALPKLEQYLQKQQAG